MEGGRWNDEIQVSNLRFVPQTFGGAILLPMSKIAPPTWQLRTTCGGPTMEACPCPGTGSTPTMEPVPVQPVPTFPIKWNYKAIEFIFNLTVKHLQGPTRSDTSAALKGQILIFGWPKWNDLYQLWRGSWGIFGDSSVTLAQWWRARDSTNLVIHRSPVRFRPKTRQLRFTCIWANRPWSKGSKLLFPVIKAN